MFGYTQDLGACQQDLAKASHRLAALEAVLEAARGSLATAQLETSSLASEVEALRAAAADADTASRPKAIDTTATAAHKSELNKETMAALQSSLAASATTAALDSKEREDLARRAEELGLRCCAYEAENADLHLLCESLQAGSTYWHERCTTHSLNASLFLMGHTCDTLCT